LPESVGTTDYKKMYLQQEIERQVNIPAEDKTAVYHEYFAYSSAMLRLQEPTNWRESLPMLTEVAE
jgi:hypothetical protein